MPLYLTSYQDSVIMMYERDDSDFTLTHDTEVAERRSLHPPAHKQIT